MCSRLKKVFYKYAEISKIFDAKRKNILDTKSDFSLEPIIFPMFTLLGARKCYGINSTDYIIK